MLIHIVKSGETLFSVAKRYGVPLFYLASCNGIKNGDRLAVGQAIAVVFPLQTYTVSDGDTLYSVANRLGTTVGAIYKNNLSLKGKPDIYPGQTLIIKIDRTPFGAWQIGGYAYPFIPETLLNTSLPFMNYIMPFTYGFNRDGSLVSPDDGQMLARSRVYGTKPVMHLSTLTEDGSFSSENAAYLLNNETLWETLCGNVIENMEAKDYYALDIDFEFVGGENAVKYAEFVSYMRYTLNENGYAVIVALAPKTRDDQPGLLYEGHDYRLLGKAANCVLLMTYEWGYTYGPPLAVSPVPNVRKVIEYAVTRIEPSKIFEGIPNYGYDFTLPYVAGESKAVSLSTDEAYRLAYSTDSVIEYDQTALSPYFYYSSDNKAHVVWFEDARSIREKLYLIGEYGLRGGLYWNLNRENAQNLTVINSYIDRAEPNLF